MTSHRPELSADLDAPSLAPAAPRHDLQDRLQPLLEQERRALELQKHDSLSILAGGIAHDFNNLLAVVIGQVELVASDPVLTPKSQDALSSAIAAAQRAAGLTRQLLDYAGRGQLRQRTFCVATQLTELVRSLRPKLPAQLTLELALEPQELLVSGDPDRLQQSVLNLISNAVEACSGRAGTIALRLFEQQVSEALVADVHPPQPVRPGDYVCLEVRDDGPGMSTATMRRVFEPFFSTKGSGRGLGLAAALGVVRAHGGFLTVHSEPSRGATFRLHLPLISAARTSQPAIATAPTASRAGVRSVLVVDDEPMIRTFVRSMLQEEGYIVHDAASGSEALAILEGNLSNIGGVLLDLTMPGMDGATVLSTLRTFAPDLPVVLQTGYSAEVTAQRLAQWRVHGVLQKPYRAAQLLQTVGTMFAADS